MTTIHDVLNGESEGCIVQGDCLEVMRTMPDGCIDCCVTSPPYWGLRSYLPDTVRPRPDCPAEVISRLESLGVFPIDGTGG